MTYWGSKPDNCDYAFGSIGAYIFLLKERMFDDIAIVLAKSHPEQGLVASLVCLRLIGEQFPKNLSVHFRKKDFARAKELFYEWYEIAKPKLPAKHRDAILAEAERQFALFEERILK